MIGQPPQRPSVISQPPQRKSVIGQPPQRPSVVGQPSQEPPIKENPEEVEDDTARIDDAETELIEPKPFIVTGSFLSLPFFSRFCYLNFKYIPLKSSKM